jgi:hypothetical protein
MNTTDPYERSAESVQSTAVYNIKEIMRKGLPIDGVINAINAGLDRVERKIKRDKFNVDALSRKYELENKLVVANKIKSGLL